jgi:hypothetical protein
LKQNDYYFSKEKWAMRKNLGAFKRKKNIKVCGFNSELLM